MAKKINEITSKKIRFLRKRLSLTQDELAAKVGLASGQAIKFYEMGIRTPSYKILLKFVSLARLNNFEDINSIQWFYE